MAWLSVRTEKDREELTRSLVYKKKSGSCELQVNQTKLEQTWPGSGLSVV